MASTDYNTTTSNEGGLLTTELSKEANCLSTDLEAECDESDYYCSEVELEADSLISAELQDCSSLNGAGESTISLTEFEESSNQAQCSSDPKDQVQISNSYVPENKFRTFHPKGGRRTPLATYKRLIGSATHLPVLENGHVRNGLKKMVSTTDLDGHCYLAIENTSPNSVAPAEQQAYRGGAPSLQCQAKNKEIKILEAALDSPLNGKIKHT